MTVGRDASAPLRRAEAEPRRTQPSHQLDTRHLDGTGRDQPVSVLLRNVVVITLETTFGDAVGRGEGV